MILEPKIGNGSTNSLGPRRKSVITLTRGQGKTGRRPSYYDLPSFSRQHSSSYDSQFYSTSSLGVSNHIIFSLNTYQYPNSPKKDM